MTPELYPHWFDPQGLLSPEGQIENLEALGLWRDGRLTQVGLFLLERVEVNIFPWSTHNEAREVKGTLLYLLTDALRGPILSEELSLHELVHLLALRFVKGGIPSNPVEVHLFLENPGEGVITMDELFIPVRSKRVLCLTEAEKLQAIAALRIYGVLRQHEIPGDLDMEAVEQLPLRGYRVEQWPKVMHGELELCNVWRFRFGRG